MPRQIFKIISQKPDIGETVCNDINILFHKACTKLYLDNRSPLKKV